MPELGALIGQHFAYASGRTGVLQQLLLSHSDIDRLLGAHDITEAKRILTELKLTSIAESASADDDVAILQAVGAWVRREVEQMSPAAKRPTFRILWLEDDAPLLSYLLKTHHGLAANGSSEPKTSMTSYNPEELRALILEGKDGALPEHLVQFVKEMHSAEVLTPEAIDTSVAQYVADLQLRLARVSGSDAILRYVLHRIDLTNIRTALRLRDEENAMVILPHLLEGGSIPREALTGDVHATLAAIERSDLRYSLADAVEKGLEDLGALERAFSDVTASDIAHMWNIPLSIEPLFAFGALAASQLRLLRVLLIGKRSGMAPQEIKTMLPPFLSASHYVL